MDEQQVIKMSIGAALLLSALALVFALVTSSGAILFDGVYSLIAVSMSLLTLRVSRLVAQPGDDAFHFGYAALEPLLNLFKSLIILVSCCYAIVVALISLLDGGNAIRPGAAVAYGSLSALVGLLVAWALAKKADVSRSDLLAVEAKTWLFDGLFSCAVLLGFLGAWFLQMTRFADYVAYVDPALLLLLVLAALPMPIKILRNSFKEVVGVAPPDKYLDLFRDRVREFLDMPHVEIDLRAVKTGRRTFIHCQVLLPAGCGDEPFSYYDQLRNQCLSALKQEDKALEAEVNFVLNHPRTGQACS